MRSYTIALSIVAHVIAACALIIVPLVATDELPAPRTATEFIRVVAPLEPPTPPPPRASAKPAVEPPRADAAPLAVPDGIQPEPVIEPSSDGAPVDTGVIGFGSSDSVIADPVPPPPSSLSPVLRVGGDIRRPQKITEVAPVYPAIARAAHVEGVVILEAVIGEDGGVRNVRVLRSIPLLDAAAVDAVRQWRFTATLLNGEPVPVVMTITVAFRLRR
jgi:periplasmic protein TonB